jgi:hypothetical protein
MPFYRRLWCCLLALVAVLNFSPIFAVAQSSSSSRTSSSRKTTHADSSLDPGSVTNGVYRNKTLGFTCKIPAGWMLRTDEMNARDEEDASANASADSVSDPAKDPAKDQTKPGAPPASSAGAKVLLAAFSRPPAAKGEDVNSSILIVAESAVAYPGLKDALQYFDPLTEVAKAQGFEIDEDPYEIAIGKKTLARGDFHKDVASRVMHQSTLAMLAHGYAVSFTVIAGTDDDVENLIDGLDFAASAGAKK